MKSSHDIFLSYSRRNLDAAKTIKAVLEAAGLSCWADWDGIPSGVGSFISMGASAIQETKAAFLFILTSDSQASDWAMEELMFAKERARKRVVLVRINDDEMTDEFYFNFQSTDIIDWRIAEQRERLLRDLLHWAGKEETGQRAKPGGIFISYSRANLAPVTAIKEELEARGFPCWMDLHGGRGGIESGSEEFTKEIAKGITDSKALLFILTNNSQQSRWSLNELRLARSKNKHVVIARYNDDKMLDHFMLEFGGADTIDWRIPEEKEKLLGDLRRWCGEGEEGMKTPMPGGPSREATETGQCSKCHRWRPLTEMFECERCGKTYCVAHQDPGNYLCQDCALAQREAAKPKVGKIYRAKVTEIMDSMFSAEFPSGHKGMVPRNGELRKAGYCDSEPKDVKVGDVVYIKCVHFGEDGLVQAIRVGQEELRRAAQAGEVKIGRNDPCPCGSGKKYKKCCGVRSL